MNIFYGLALMAMGYGMVFTWPKYLQHHSRDGDPDPLDGVGMVILVLTVVAGAFQLLIGIQVLVSPTGTDSTRLFVVFVVINLVILGFTRFITRKP